MSKIVAFSDLHGHLFKAYATLLASGRNNRLQDAINVVRQVRDYAISIGATIVLFGGDLFHIRKHVPVVVFNALYEELAMFSAYGLKLVMIHGNHDQADRLGEEYSIYAFGAFAEVVDKAKWVYVDDGAERIAVLGLPYWEQRDDIKRLCETEPEQEHDRRILLGHFGVQGAQVGADFVYTNPFDVEIADLNVKAFDLALLGHYHLPQQLAPNCWYIGAPLQHNWGDKHQARGYVSWDTATKDFTFVNSQMPQFVQLTDDEVEAALDHSAPPALPESYVRIETVKKYSESDREQLRKQYGWRSLEFVPPKSGKQVEAPRLAVDPMMGTGDVISTYVHSGIVSTDGLDENYLVQLAQEVMAEVEEAK
jgi:DNA repair exonuclease SbcCD nuclease subunit